MRPTIIAVVDDLFFASKIQGTGEQVGARVLFVKSVDEAIQKARNESPGLIIVDLNAHCCHPMDLARAFKSDDQLSGIPLLGFFSHVQTELQRAAVAGGFDRVMPRSAFTKQLPEVLAGTPISQNTA
jgi:CheY-like chemotaxis protein